MRIKCTYTSGRTYYIKEEIFRHLFRLIRKIHTDAPMYWDRDVVPVIPEFVYGVEIYINLMSNFVKIIYPEVRQCRWGRESDNFYTHNLTYLFVYENIMIPNGWRRFGVGLSGLG